MTAALYIKDASVNALAIELQKVLKAPSKTEAVRIALQRQLDEAKAEETLDECITKLQDTLAKYPRTGLAADKAFFDSLGGDL